MSIGISKMTLKSLFVTMCKCVIKTYWDHYSHYVGASHRLVVGWHVQKQHLQNDLVQT